jgi:hypothetical protein
MTEKGLPSHSVHNIMSITICDDMGVSDSVEDKRLKGGERKCRPYRLSMAVGQVERLEGSIRLLPPAAPPFWIARLRE